LAEEQGLFDMLAGKLAGNKKFRQDLGI